MKILKAISSAFLAMLVLLSSMGFFVDHMVCGMSGEHKLAINKAIESCSDSCAPTEKDVLNSNCCDYESFYFKEDLSTTPSESKERQVVSSSWTIPFHKELVALISVEDFSFLKNREPELLPSLRKHILLQTYLI